MSTPEALPSVGKRFQRGLWWVKRDFRIDDNDALLAAVAQCEAVNALFIIEPSLCKAQESSLFHYHAWQQATEHLSSQLQQLGGVLHVMIGETVAVLDSLYRNAGFDALYSHQETGSHITFQRDLAVKQWTRSNAIHWHEAHQNGVIRGLKNRDERRPVIRERLMNTQPSSAPARVKSWPLETNAIEFALADNSPWPTYESLSGRTLDTRIRPSETQSVTERCASQVLHDFLNSRGVAYSGGISSPNTAFEAGSRLSAHLAWGTISLRRVFHATWERDRELARSSTPQARQWRKSLKAFQSRLHWHDHFIQRLESAPSMEFEVLNPAYRNIGYADNQPLLDAWQNGQTGLPLIDACIRCLAATGFLNFRMRAMVVSTGCFGMAQSWKSLYYPLARLFLDYEPGIHFSQIQMQAGIVGINTLRVYSPHKQLLDQDPQARFVKRWIPELREFDATEIAQYNQRSLGDYQEPVTDFAANTRIIRDQIYAVRKSAEGREASADVLQKHGSRLPGNDRSGRQRSSVKKGRKKATSKPVNDSQMTLDFGD